MHQLEGAPRLLEYLHRRVYLRQFAHAGRDKSMFLFRGYFLEQLDVHYHRGSHLVVSAVELPQKLLTVHVPGRGEPLYPQLLAVAVYLFILLQAELQRLFLRALRLPPR